MLKKGLLYRVKKMAKRIMFFSLLICAVTSATFLWADELELKIFEIQRGDAQSMYEIVKDLKSTEGRMSVDSNTNSLIVVDSPKNIARIGEVIERLDMKPKQVKIDVVITEVTDLFLEEAGIGSSQVVIPSGRYAVLLNLLKSKKESRIRTEMTVRTLSNKPAVIQATVDEIFGHIIAMHTDSATGFIFPIYAQTGDYLEVLPRVNNDGTIMVTLRPSTGGFTEDGTLHEKTALTEVVVNNGDTLVIGGVNNDSVETKKEGPPLLGNPLSKTDSGQRQRVLMFLTATVDE